MARIRTLKPELPQDVKLASVSRDARYTFVLLITQADDEGLVPGAHRQLLGLLYPHDDDVTAPRLLEWVEELVSIGAIRWRATVDGAPVLELVNWSKHQRVDNKGRSVLVGFLAPLPDPAEVRGGSPQLAATRRSEVGPGTGEVGKGPGSVARAKGPAEEALEQQCGADYPAVVRFLDERPPRKREEWAADLLQLIGPVTGILPADLARACQDGALATPPVTSARALRIFATTCRDERVRGTVKPISRPSDEGSENAAVWADALTIVGRLTRGEIGAEAYAALPDAVKAGFRACDGWTGIRDARPNDIPFRKRDFLAAYRAAANTPAKVPA